MGTKPKLTKEQISEAVEMVRGGLSFREVARRFGVDPETIRQHCIKRGVTSQFKVRLKKEQIEPAKEN